MKNSPDKKQKSSPKGIKLWKLGDHRLLCGDSLDVFSVHQFLTETKINAVITDPPYGAFYTQGKANFAPIKVNKEILNDDISSEPEYAAFSKTWISAVVPHLARKNSFYIFTEQMMFALKESMENSDVYFSQLLVWIKNQAVIGRKDYLMQHEHIICGWHGSHVFKRSKDKSVLCYPKPSKSPLHPTMKPLGLIRRLILNSTDIGDAVYDPFGGSGTTLIACEETKRRCFMSELDPEYCQTIIARWEDLTKRKAEQL